VAGFCAHGNEYLGSIKGEEFLDHLSDYKFLYEKLSSMELYAHSVNGMWNY
jgi:hypothetical protein